MVLVGTGAAAVVVEAAVGVVVVVAAGGAEVVGDAVVVVTCVAPLLTALTWCRARVVDPQPARTADSDMPSHSQWWRRRGEHPPTRPRTPHVGWWAEFSGPVRFGLMRLAMVVKTFEPTPTAAVADGDPDPSTGAFDVDVVWLLAES
jgi:hypothetical protein